MNLRLLPCIFLPLLSVSVMGQSTTNTTSTSSTTGTYTAGTGGSGSKPAGAGIDYAGESVVIERLDKVYEMAADGTGSQLTTVVARVQSDAALRQLGVLNIGYASSSERVEIVYARARQKDGTVLETPVTQAIDMPNPVTTQAPFYSDLKQMQLPVRSLKVGDTLEWQAKVVRTKAEAVGQFWGQESFPTDGIVLEESVELRVPKDKFVNVWSPTIKPVETMVGGQKVFRWTNSQLKPTVGKEADAEKESKKKLVWTADQELDAAEGKLPTIAWTSFASWEAVGAWYRTLEGQRMEPDAEIKAKVAEVVAGKTTEEEKVRAVYGYVATQIRYIGVAFGVGRYQPHQASDVLQNQYGDCKDKHTLLAAMLEALGLHPDAVLIGAGVRFNEAVPSPASFNHLITRVSVGGQPVWLDATTEVAPYRMLSYVIRDKNGLVVPETGAAKIERTPAGLPFASFQTMDSVGTLDKDGLSNSRLVLTMRGDDELIIRMAFRQTAPAQYEQLVQQISQGIGYAGTTSHVEVTRPEDTAEPFKISYDYKREKGGDWPNLKIVPQVAPVSLPRPDEKEPPVQSIRLGVPHVETSTSAMKLPDGWRAELPEAVHAKSDYATYDETYRFEKGTVYAERKIVVLKEKVPVSDWKSYKKWADDADLENDQYVQLVTNEQKTSGGKEGVQATTDNAEATKLISSAAKAMQQHDLDGAKKMLDQAKSLNESQPYLWANYGYLEYLRGEMSVAIVDYQKELALFPERYGTYQSLAWVQSTMGRRGEAKATLQQWADANPRDPTPYSLLINMLVEDKDGAGAVAVADKAAKLLPEDQKNDETLQLAVGQAQIMAGMKEKGAATLVALVKTTQSPLMMNNGAYELAEAGVELPLAESYTRTALEKMGEESRTWTLDESPQVVLGKSIQIVATWDTMGWILYREGKLEEAESYVKAAWINAPSPTLAEHLGEIEAARGRKDDALTTYALGVATIPQYDALGVKKSPGTEDKKLQARVEELRKSGAKTSLRDAQDGLQKLRTVPLGAAKGMNGVAEYRLLLSDGKVQRAEKMGTNEVSGGDERLQQTQLIELWPTGSKANLVRVGMLNCHSGVCELVFER
jgi:tetratricopeptide (TPR) repeat protein